MKLLKNLPICLVVIAALFFFSCDKEKNKEEPNKAIEINMAKLPVYYNGVAMNCLMEEFQKSTSKNADMAEVAVVSEEAVYIFDIDAAFYTFSVESQSLEMYLTNQKLELIHAKAVELGLTELEDEIEYADIPVEMLQYWKQVFNTSLQPPSRNAWGKIYTAQNLQQGSTNFLIFWPTFGSKNNTARSVALYGVGSSWLCTKTWFGGNKLYNYVIAWKNIKTLSPTFDKKICSHIGF